MKTQLMGTVSRFTLVLFLLIFSSTGKALNCSEVKTLTKTYLTKHYSFHEFDKTLSARTLEMYIRAWDPGKLYFYENDIAVFRKKYQDTLGSLVNNRDCRFATDILNLFSRRFEDRYKKIEGLVKAKHDFSKDEYLIIDRKKIPWATTAQELDERWRKQIKFQYLQLKDSLENNAEKIQQKILKRYQLLKKRHNELTQDEIYSRFLNAFALALDPHSSYMAPDELEDFRIQTSLSLEGIGAVLRSEDGFTVIQSIVPGGAAAKSGLLKVEDKIIAVAQEGSEPVDIIDMDLREVVKLIRGPRGTKVYLTIVREEKGKTTKLVVPIVREKVQLKDRIAKGRIVDVEIQKTPKEKKHLKVGLINLPSFYVDFDGQRAGLKDYRSASRDLKKVIDQLKKKKADALVIDLRTNGGGSLSESINIAGLFIKQGPVVQIKEKDNSIDPQFDVVPTIEWSGPLVLAVSRQSASASEILAGAMQDYKRGIIVGGDHTFGKGTVQNLHVVSQRLGAIKVTTSKFYRPSGSSTQLKGVEVDLQIPSFLTQLDLGEKFYDYALEWDKISPAKYSHKDMVTPYLPKLKVASMSRIKYDKDLQEIIKEIEEYKAKKDERSRVSLKEEQKDKDKDKKNKTEDKKSKTKNQNQDLEESNDLDLTDDAQLREIVRIAADYAVLLANEHLGKVTIVQSSLRK